MASTITTSGANTTIAFSYTAPTATIQLIVGSAAEYLWDHGYGDHGIDSSILFSSLTNAQKLSLVEEHIKRVVVDTANTQKSVKAQEVARVAEESSKLVL